MKKTMSIPYRYQHRSPGSYLHIFGLLAFTFIVFGPLLSLVVDSAGYLASEPGQVIPTERSSGLLFNSIALAFCVAAGGIILGVMIASVLWRWQSGRKHSLRWFLLVFAPIPPYVHALAWSTSMSYLSDILVRFGLPGISLQGWSGSWWVQLMALLPIAVGLSLIGFESVEITMIEAARLVRSDIQVLLRVILPLMAPMLAAGTGILFLLSLVDYSVPSLFGLNVYSLEIFAEYGATNQPSSAFLLALPELFITLAVILLARNALKDAVQNQVRSRAGTYDWPLWFTWLQRFAIIVLFLQISILVLSLVSSAGTGKDLALTISMSRSEISFTFWICIAASLICLPFALAAAHEMQRKDWRGTVWWVLVISPLAVPAPLVGIGMVSLWNRPLWYELYGTSAMPLLALLARFTPLAAIVLMAQLRRIDPLLLDAAQVFDTHPLRTWFQVRLPLMTPGLMAAAFITFALSIGELGATLITVPPGRGTLTLKIYNYKSVM
ncbi:MAG: iron ABC transporter permease [ANME-2 cluster archaeon]|nr:iron ABC transporter permease [ANME-2 cluster archaeon]